MSCCCLCDASDDLLGETLFLNVLVENGTEGIQTIVKENVGKKLGRGLVAATIAKRAGQLASKTLSDNKIGEKMSERVTDALPSRLGEVGITAEISRVFVKGPFFVLKVIITDVDMRKLLTVRAGDDEPCFAGVFDFFGRIMAIFGGKNTYDHSINTLIAGKLQIILPDRLGSALESKGMTSVIAVKTKEEQATYFFDIITNTGFNDKGHRSHQQVTGSNSNDPIMQGIMHKLSPSFGVGLQSRYFALKGTAPRTAELMYFESKQDFDSCQGNLATMANNRKGSIICGEIQDIVIDTNVKPNKVQILITMNSTTSKRVAYHLYTGSESDASAWVAAIRKAIKDFT